MNFTQSGPKEPETSYYIVFVTKTADKFDDTDPPSDGGGEKDGRPTTMEVMVGLQCELALWNPPDACLPSERPPRVIPPRPVALLPGIIYLPGRPVNRSPPRILRFSFEDAHAHRTAGLSILDIILPALPAIVSSVIAVLAGIVGNVKSAWQGSGVGHLGPVAVLRLVGLDLYCSLLRTCAALLAIKRFPTDIDIQQVLVADEIAELEKEIAQLRRAIAAHDVNIAARERGAANQDGRLAGLDRAVAALDRTDVRGYVWMIGRT